MFSSLLEEDGLSLNCYLRSATYLFASMLCLRKIQGARERCIMVFRRFEAQQPFYFVIFLSAVICALTGGQKCLEPRESSTWWERIVNQSFDEGDWLESFRMSRSTFLYLCRIEVFGEKGHSYEKSYTFGAESQ